MAGQRVGYVRVSAAEPGAAVQLDGRTLDRVFVDAASARDRARPQLQALIEFVAAGDTVLVQSMDRLAGNLDGLWEVVRTLIGRGVRVEFVEEDLAFTDEDSPTAALLLSTMDACAGFERALLRERQLEGIAKAKQRGAYTGRKPALSRERIVELVDRAACGASKVSLAREFGISRETVYAYLRAHGTDRLVAES